MLRNVIPKALSIAVLLSGGMASAGAIQLTGFVENDFSSADKSVTVIPNSTDPYHVGQAQWMTDRGWVTGWSIKDVRLSYDNKSDTLFVGVNTFSVAGNVDGNGTPGVPDPLLTAAGGIDSAHLGSQDPGSDKSISVALAPANGNQPGTPAIVAGVPSDKTKMGPGTDGFTVAKYVESGYGINYNYGQTLTDHVGNLAFDPSKAHPGFEFTITNFSKIAGLDPTKAMFVNVYAGSQQSIVAGKDGVPWTRIPAPEAQTLPEPSTVLIWTALGGIAAWRLRRRHAG